MVQKEGGRIGKTNRAVPLMTRAVSPAELLVEALGENAPAVPKNAEEFRKLPLTTQQVLTERCGAFVQSLIAVPESLPAAVALRRERGELQFGDVDALRSAGLPLEAAELIEKQGERELQRLRDELQSMREARNIPIEHQKQAKAHEERVRRLSRQGYVGRIN